MEPGVAWVRVGGACNSRCCDIRDLPEITADQVRASACERPVALVLTGPGEPTLRRDLDALVHAARRGGASNVALVTNGRALAYASLADRVASLDFRLVAVTLLHDDPAEHDRLARVPGAHAQSIAGIRNLAARGVPAAVRTTSAAAVPGLAALAHVHGASFLWLDSTEEASTPASPAVPVLPGRAFEDRLLRSPHAFRSREGHVPARMHPQEGAVSCVLRTGCRNSCLFCTTRIIQEAGRAPWPLDDLAVFHASLEEGARSGLRSLRFVAVEPLEHPDLPDLVALARRLGYERTEAWTSARALSDPSWADRLSGAGLTHIDVPLLGPDAAVHDLVAGSRGSFEETMRGLSIGIGRLDVAWHLVVTRQGQHRLGETVTLARDLGLGDPVSVLIPSPSSGDTGIYGAFASRMTDLAAEVSSLPPDLSRLLTTRGLAAQIPPCILERTPGLDARGVPVPAGEWVREGKLDEPGAALKLRSPCPLSRSCGASARCPGYHALYARLFGTSEFTPL